MIQNSSQRSIYLDSQRHSSFQRIRHGYIERPLEEVTTSSDEEDLDLELHNAFVRSQKLPENTEESPTDYHVLAQSRHTDSSLARQNAPRISHTSERNLGDGEQREDNEHEEEEAASIGEDDVFIPTAAIPDFSGQAVRYRDAREFWRLHLVLVETMIPEDVEIKNKVLTQMNWDLLADLESRDQDLLQMSTRVQELTDRAARLQGSNERRRVEKEYLYEVAADLSERLDECEKQRRQILSNQSNIWAIPSPKDQDDHNEMRELIDHQNDEIAQLQIEVLDKDEEIKDLTHFLEMAVQTQNDLTFELNELILRDREPSIQATNFTDAPSPPYPTPVPPPSIHSPAPPAPSPPIPPQAVQEPDDPITVLNLNKQNPRGTEVQDPAASTNTPPAPAACRATSTEEDIAKLKTLLNFPRVVRELPALVDQGVQVRQRDMNYPPVNIGSYAQRSTFVIMGTLIDIKPDTDEPYPPSKKLLDAAAVLIRQSMHSDTDIPIPPRASHEDLQSAIRQNRDKISARYSPEALERMLNRYIDELAASQGSSSRSVSSDIIPIQPIALPRRNGRDVLETASRPSRPLNSPFNTPGRDRASDNYSLWAASFLVETPEQYSSRAGAAIDNMNSPVQMQIDISRTSRPGIPSRPERVEQTPNQTRSSPLRTMASQSDPMSNTPDLSPSGGSPGSSFGPSIFSPPTPDIRAPTRAASHPIVFRGLQTKRTPFNEMHDGIDRDSLNAPRMSQLIRDIEGFNPSQLASPVESNTRSPETVRLEALDLLEGPPDGGETDSPSSSSGQITRTTGEHPNTQVRQESGPSQLPEGPNDPNNPAGGPASSPHDSSNHKSSSQASDTSTPDHSGQSIDPTNPPSPHDPIAKEPNYFYIRVGDRYIAIPLSLSDLWTAVKPVLPSRHLWWLCVPYLMILFYLGWTTWLSKEEWYEQNRGYIRADVMERRGRSWQFNEGSTLSKLVIMIFDRIYQPLPPGSYA